LRNLAKDVAGLRIAVCLCVRDTNPVGNDDLDMEQEQELQFSDLEAWILETVDNIGWYAYLWFPVVYREVLNFGDDSPDAEIYVAFSGLVRKGALEHAGAVKWGGADVPQWKVSPRALAIAQKILRSKFGWPDAYRPRSKVT
jgi:hypothetical protein